MDFNGAEFRVGAIYKSPASALHTPDIDKLMDTNSNVILAGDLNAKNPAWHSYSTNQAGRILQNHMEQHDYTIIAPDTPTHYPDIHSHSPDVLDIALLQTCNLQFTLQNLNDLSSDHNPVLLDVHTNSYRIRPTINRTLTNWNRFGVKLHEAIKNPNPLLATTSQIDSAVENITTQFQEAISATSTSIIIDPHKDLPMDIKNALAKKKWLRRKWQHTRDPDFKRQLNKQSELVRQKLTDHCNREWHHTLDSLRPNDPKLFRINRGLITKKPANHPLHGPNGLVYDPRLKAELFAAELQQQFTCPPGTDNINLEVSEKTAKLRQPHPRDVQSFTPGEVWDVIKSLPRRKAPGPDRITNSALKHSPKRAILHLTKIYNCCLRLEYFPTAWKNANVIMIPKSGKNRFVPTNHRPISLLNSMAKLYEILLLSRLRTLTSNFIRPEQFAFRQGHSTSNQLTKLVDELAISFNRKERTVAVFLDYEKAFDKVWHQGLLAKMTDLQLPIQLANTIKSFLEHRHYSVRQDDAFSTPRGIAAGVPQGSCLSPLLFSLYINDMPSLPGTRLNLFADDTMFMHTSMSKHFAAKKIQLQIDLVTSWLRDWRITLNSGKTVAVLFGDKQPDDICPIEVNGVAIEWSSSVKYLGIKLDAKLRFAQHVKETCTKARRIRAALYPMLNSHSPIPIRTKLAILKMYIHSILTYAGPAWGALVAVHRWKQLEAVQNIALRTITGLPKYVRNSAIRNSLNIPTIQESISGQSHKMFHRTSTSHHPHLQNLGLSMQTVQWKRNRPANLLD
jgi:hypothetical protein